MRQWVAPKGGGRGRRALAAGITRVIAAALAASPLVHGLWAGALASCNDGPLPSYPVPSSWVRLIPERGSIGKDGGSVFVLVELHEQADAAAHPVVVQARAKGATMEPLPGEACSEPGAASVDGGIDGDAGEEGVKAGEGDLILPDITLLARDGQQSRTGGFLVDVPAGEAPVELVATAYSHTGALDACQPAGRALLAFGTAEITRDLPDAGDGDEPDAGADSGGHGGSGGAGTASTSSSASGSGGDGGKGGSGMGGSGMGGAGGAKGG